MPNSWLHRILNSVFLKLLLVILITGVCINLAVASFFMYFYMGSMQNRPLRKNVVQYLSYLVRDLGEPPDFQQGKEIAERLSMGIRCEGPDAAWTTSPSLPPIAQMRLKQLSETPRVFLGRHQGKSFLVVQEGPRQYAFDLVKSYEQQRFAEVKILLLVVLLTGLLACVYFVIRRILNPIKWLDEGVQQVGRGNLDHRLPVHKKDELGKLAEAFNAMTVRIKEMLHAREQLLLNVSHELRSPLTRMKVALEFLPETDAKKSLGEDVAEMEVMVAEILETERLRSEFGQLNLEKTDLESLVQEAAAPFEQKSPGICFESRPWNVSLELDRQRIKTVLKNILENALKYSEAGQGPVQVSAALGSAEIVLQIKDSGKGIPPEDLPHIFEPFYRVDKSRNRSTGGYGLGLSLCKTIMEAHGGKVAVDSQFGQGTTVRLFFRLL